MRYVILVLFCNFVVAKEPFLKFCGKVYNETTLGGGFKYTLEIDQDKRQLKSAIAEALLEDLILTNKLEGEGQLDEE